MKLRHYGKAITYCNKSVLKRIKERNINFLKNTSTSSDSVQRKSLPFHGQNLKTITENILKPRSIRYSNIS